MGNFFLYAMTCFFATACQYNYAMTRQRQHTPTLAAMLRTIPTDLQTEIRSFFVQPNHIDYRLLPAVCQDRVIGTLRDNPQRKETRVIPAHLARQLDYLSLQQINFILDLYHVNKPLISLTREQRMMFKSLPEAIQKNLLQNYSFRLSIPQIIAEHRLELLPAIIPVTSIGTLREATQTIKTIMRTEHPRPDSEKSLPIIMQHAVFDGKKWVLQEPLYQRDRRQLSDEEKKMDAEMREKEEKEAAATKIPKKRRLKLLDPGAQPGQPLPAEYAASTYQDALRIKREQLALKPYSFLVLGLANHELDVYAQEVALQQLKKLSEEQLQFMIDLYAMPAHEPIILNEPQQRWFNQLPPATQTNLMNNYTLAFAHPKPPFKPTPCIQAKLPAPAYRRPAILFFTCCALYCTLKWLIFSQNMPKKSRILSGLLGCCKLLKTCCPTVYK